MWKVEVSDTGTNGDLIFTIRNDDVIYATMRHGRDGYFFGRVGKTQETYHPKKFATYLEDALNA